MKRPFSLCFLLPLLFGLTGISFNGYCGVTNTAIANGSWSAASTWSEARAPQHGDDIVVPRGMTVTVDINSPTYSAMTITVRGTLNFENGQKINLDCDGYVSVEAGGQLSGGNPGSKIDICNSTAWNGPGPTYGPVSYGNTLLPIELLDFTAEVANKTQVSLKWSTATEKNNSYFTLERSQNGATFIEVAREPGAGNSNTVKYYSATDPNPIEGTSYYRLKQTDYDGKYEYSGLVSIEYTKTVQGCILKIYPNPCLGECKIDLAECENDESPELTVEVFDAAGRKVYSKIPERDTKGSFSLTIDKHNNLKPGIYIIRGSSKSEEYTKKMMMK